MHRQAILEIFEIFKLFYKNKFDNRPDNIIIPDSYHYTPNFPNQVSAKRQAWIGFDLKIINLFQVKIFGLLWSKKFSSQNIWLD